MYLSTKTKRKTSSMHKKSPKKSVINKTYKRWGHRQTFGYRWKYQLYSANKETKVYKEKSLPNKMIRNSKLSSFNKIIVHDTFAVPVFIPSVGRVDWTINEIREIDCKTTKQLTMTGNFHANGEVDYIPLYTKVRSNLALPSWLTIMKISLLPKI